MKATLFAVVLSLLAVSFQSYSAEKISKAENVIKNSTPGTEQLTNKIHLNKADVTALTKSFKGIGKKRAEAIVSYRETHGSFKSVEDLAQVRGLGKQFVSSHLTQLQAVFDID